MNIENFICQRCNESFEKDGYNHNFIIASECYCEECKILNEKERRLELIKKYKSDNIDELVEKLVNNGVIQF